MPGNLLSHVSRISVIMIIRINILWHKGSLNTHYHQQTYTLYIVMPSKIIGTLSHPGTHSPPASNSQQHFWPTDMAAKDSISQRSPALPGIIEFLHIRSSSCCLGSMYQQGLEEPCPIRFDIAWPESVIPYCWSQI